MASQVAAKQSARTFELQRRKFALMAAEHVQALGERIRLRREELGMTQDEVARKMKGSVDGQRISKWERGENRPRDESLEDLARVLETTAVELLAPAPDKRQTPDLAKPQLLDPLAARLDAIERTLQQQRAERDQHVQTIKALLADQDERLKRQDVVLQRIEAAIVREDAAKKATEEATRRLLAAVDVATQAYAGAPPREAAARGSKAT